MVNHMLGVVEKCVFSEKERKIYGLSKLAGILVVKVDGASISLEIRIINVRNRFF
jgi:hypothetical protein